MPNQPSRPNNHQPATPDIASGEVKGGRASALSSANGGNGELARNFEGWLAQQNLSPASIRNYVSDVNGFLEWQANLQLFERQFTSQAFNQYRQHLVKIQKPLASANRSLSSLRQFGAYLAETHLADQDPTEDLKNITKEELTTPPPKQSLTQQFAQSLTKEQLAEATIKNYVSDVNQFFAWLSQYEQGVDLQGFPPQLITQFRQYLRADLQVVPASIDRKISSLRRFFSWAKKEGLITQDPLAGEEKKHKLSPLLLGDRWTGEEKPQLPEEPFWEKLKQHWQIITLTGIVLLIILLLSLFRPWQYLPEIGIQEVSTQPNRQLAIPTQSPQATLTTLASNPWIVSFRGKLTSAVTRQPQTQAATIIFTLYRTETDVTPLWTSKEWELAPDQNGNFYAPLGDATRGDNEIPSRIFFLHDHLFLAASIEGQELKPRTRISTAANSANAYLLEQHPPQEETGIGGIPVIDQAGALTLAAPSPKIKALNDTFAIEGQAITLTTPFASDGSITLKPDGAGSVKVLGSNPTGNTLSVTNANLITGALLSANLGSSLTTPYLLSLSAGASPSAKFTVDAAGNMVLSGSVKGQTELTLADSRASALFSDTSNTTLPGGAKSILGALKLAYDKTATSSTTTTSPWTDGGDYLYPTNRESVRIYDSAGTDYLQLAHSGTALNFTAVNTSDLSIYLPIVLRDTATFERRAIFSDLVRLYNTSSDPTNIGEGSLYYNTTNDLLRVYTGAGWIDVGSSLWTDGGTTTYLTSTSDDLALGGTGSTAPFFMDVSTGNLSITGDLDVNGNDITSASNLTINPDGTADIYFHSSSYQISDTGDLTIGGRTTFENSEFIDNETDGSLILNDSGGNTLTFDLDGTHPTLSSSTTAFGLDDDLQFIGAQTITTSTGDLTIDTAGTLVVSDVTDLDVNSTTAFTVGDGSANTLTVNTTGDLVTVTGDLTVGNGVIANGFGFLTVNRAATISALIASDDPLTLKNASGNRVFDIDSTGLITLANSETVSNSSNGSLVLADSGGNTLTFDLDATHPTLESSTTQIAINDNLALANDKVIALGGVSPLAYQAVANSGGSASSGTVNADNDLYVQGSLESSEFCIGGDCISSWTAGTGLWQNTSNAFHPRNQYTSVVDVLVGSNATASAKVRLPGLTNKDAFFNLGTGNVGIGDTTPSYKLEVVGTGRFSSVLYADGGINTSAGNLSLDSTGGTTQVNDNLTVTGTTSLGDGGSTNYAQFNATGDLAFFGTGNTITGPAGGLTLTGGTGAGDDLTLVSTTNVTKGDIYFHSTSYYVNSSGQLTLNTDETINGIDINAGAISDVDSILGNATSRFAFGGVALQNYNALSDAGTSNRGLASDNDLFIEGTLEVDGDGYFDNQLCLQGNCINSWSGGGAGLWQNNGNAFHPREAYAKVVDLLVGGTASTSAVFQVTTLGANAGNASASGNFVLRDGGSLVTTKMGTLTIGDTNTGRVVINPGSDYLDIDTGTVDFSTQATSVDVINANAAALSFESGLLRLDTAATAVEVTGTTNLGDGGTTNYASFNATGDLTFNGTADTIIGPAGGLTITGGTGAGDDLTLVSTTNVTKGDIYFHSASYYVNSSGQLTLNTDETINGIDINAGAISDIDSVLGNATSRFALGGIALQNYNALSDSGGATSRGLASDDDLYIEGDLEVDSIGYFDNQICLQGSCISSWTSGAAGLWQNNGNAFHPREAYAKVVDVLVGSTATVSATVRLPGLTNKDAFFNLGTGNLGIGTTTPTQKLDVVGGSIRTNADLYSGDLYLGYDDVSATITTSDDESLTLDPSGTGSIYFHSASYSVNASGQLTMNTDETINGIDINAGAVSDIDSILGNATSRFAFGGITLQNYNAISDSGGATNHGLASDDDLYVEGDVEIDGTLYVDGNLLPPASGVSGYWRRTNNSLAPYHITDDILVGNAATASALVRLPGLTNQHAFFNLGTGSLGIGTTTPATKLQVAGDIAATAADSYSLGTTALEWSSLYLADATGLTAGGGLFFGSDQDFLLAYDAATSNALELSDGTNTFLSMADAGSTANIAFNTDDLYIKSDGNVGIGTTSPAYPLHVIGRVKDPDLKSEVYHLDGEFSYLQGAQDVFVSGNYAYVASNTSSSLTIMDISDPTNPTLKSEVRDADGEFNRLQGASGVFVSGKYAYVASPGDRSLTIMDISDPTNPVLKSEVYNADGEFNRLTGAVDVYVSGNYAYVASNQTNGDSLTIMDISDPTDPVLKSEVYDADGEFNRLDGAQSVFVSGNYAYVAASGDHALTIMDISDPANPVLKSEVYDVDGEFNRLQAASSVFVSGNYAYVAASGDHALTIMDISNPANPALKSEVYDADGEFNRLNGAYTVFVAGDYAYVTSIFDASLTIMDISNPANPALKSEVYDADGEFNRLNGAMSVFVSGNYAYVASQYDNSFTTIDVSGGQISNLATGALKSGSLQVMDNALFDNDVFITGSLTAIDAFFSGDVGIYNDGAQTALTVKQDGTGDLFNLFDNSTEVFTVINGGSVGIGDTSPDHLLDVAGNIGLNASGYINFGDTDGDSGYGFKDNGGTLQFKNSGGSWTNFGSGTAYWALTSNAVHPRNEYASVVDVLVGSNATASATVRLPGLTNQHAFFNLGTGNVGIGITNPATKLDIDSGSNTTALRLRGLAETAEIGDIYMGSSGEMILSTITGTDTGGYLDLRPEDNEYGLVLRESDGTGTTTYANFYVTDSGSVDYLTLNVNSITDGDALVITEQNRVGVGTTTPSSKLHLVGDYTGGWLATFNNTSTNGLTANGMLIQVNRDGATALKVASGSANLLSVSTALLRADVPASFSAQGDVSIANDLWFTDLSANYIKSDGNLYIEAGDANAAENLYLRSAGTGDVVVGSGTTYFKNSGNVGIGLTNPGAKLMLADAAYVGNYMWGDSDNSGAEKRAWIAFGQSGTVAAPSISWATGIKTTGEYAITRRTSAWADPADTPSFLIDANGQVGIGTSTPGNILHVKGGLCVQNATACPANSAGQIYYDTGSSLFDLAEEYNTEESVEPGDLLSISHATQEKVRKSSRPYDSRIIGPVSTNPNIVFATGMSSLGGKNGIEKPNTALVTLSGRVPLKVSLENGAIQPGDLLTSSSIPGIAMKAVKAGTVVGKALETFDQTSEENKIMAFVNVSWYDPDAYLTDSGDVLLETESYDGLLAEVQSSNLKDQSYSVKLKTGEIINRIGAFKDVVVGGMKAALVETTNLIADTAVIRQAKIGEKIISPTIETDELRIKNQELRIKNNAGETVVSFDESGKATFGDLIVEGDASISGKLTADTIEARNTKYEILNTNTATISGELYANSSRFQKLRAAEITADKIKAETIEGLDAKIANILAATMSAGTANIYEYPEKGPSLTEGRTLSNPELAQWEKELDTLLSRMDAWDEATVSGSWTGNSLATNYQPLTTSSLDADLGTFNTHLAVLGQATITNLEVTSSLNIANSLQFTSDSISTLGCVGADGFAEGPSLGEGRTLSSCTLYLQPSGIGKLDFLAGAMTIDEQGNVHVKGDLYIAGKTTTKDLAVKETATVSGSLFAGLLRPINGRLDVILNASEGSSLEEGPSLGEGRTLSNDKLRIANQYGNEVASVDASGSARFNKLLIAGAAEASPSGTGFAQLFESRVKSSATAGTATLKAGETDLIIENPQLTDKSLVYVTPTSDTKNQVLYVKAKASCQLSVVSCQPYFIVSINQPLTKDVKFNWWIIN